MMIVLVFGCSQKTDWSSLKSLVVSKCRRLSLCFASNVNSWKDEEVGSVKLPVYNDNFSPIIIDAFSRDGEPTTGLFGFLRNVAHNGWANAKALFALHLNYSWKGEEVAGKRREKGRGSGMEEKKREYHDVWSRYRDYSTILIFVINYVISAW